MAKTYKCAKCNKRSSYTGRCFECKKEFCYEHLHCLQYNLDRMKDTDRVRDLCAECKEKFNYKTL